ncbi:hypothetical protein HPHPP16_0681 [Helicobacter pylori Hp P-16]|uniref:hypothetical protein n=1 Tax=Helicobacter pylori TaxID=210 RepID=UPI00026ABCAD|nr:hypothetical protein [Helicobacter pylori]EJC11358.1 hypothetical protein HPHPP16_0681 [Helicobacter pylori Hp P-16]
MPCVANHTRQDQSLQNKLFQYSLIVSNIPYSSKSPLVRLIKGGDFIIEACIYTKRIKTFNQTSR